MMSSRLLLAIVGFGIACQGEADVDDTFEAKINREKKKAGPRSLVAPADLVESASNKDIPALGGKYFQRLHVPNRDSGRLTNEITGFRLKVGNNNYHRQIVRLTGKASRLYLTKKSNMTFNGRTYIYDPLAMSGMPEAVVHMDKLSAAQRLPPFNMMLDSVAHLNYEVNSFYPTCEHQKSISVEPSNGKKLYSFARISKPVLGSWRVVRIHCDEENNPMGVEAYSLKPDKDVMRVMSPERGQIAVIRKNEKSELDFADGWLTRHEDPMLFMLTMMVVNEPQSPVG